MARRGRADDGACECLVSIEDLEVEVHEVQTGRVAVWLRHEGVEVTTDWRGRPAVPVPVARRAVEEFPHLRNELEVARARWRAEREDHEQERAEAGAVAASEAARAVLARAEPLRANWGPTGMSGPILEGRFSPEVKRRAREAAEAAREKAIRDFDRHHRAPADFSEWARGEGLELVA